MLSQAMTTKLNEQIASEFNASQTYLSMACMFESMTLKMLAKMFRKQTEEERGHALKIVDYMLEAGGTVNILPLPAPPARFESVAAAIEAALKHEEMVTQQIHNLVALAEQEKDYATRSFLQWYVDEQVEEVASTTDLLQIAKMSGQQLLLLEAYVAQMMSS